MGCRIDQIRCIEREQAARLARLQILRSRDLLARGRTRRQRKELSDELIVEESVVLRWVNLCDLMRIRGIGREYAELLEVAGVDTVRELANRNARNLAAAVRDANAVRRLVRQLPGEKAIACWIAEAEGLERMIEH